MHPGVPSLHTIRVSCVFRSGSALENAPSIIPHLCGATHFARETVGSLGRPPEKADGDFEITNICTKWAEVTCRVLEEAAILQFSDVANGTLMHAHRNRWADIDPSDDGCSSSAVPAANTTVLRVLVSAFSAALLNTNCSTMLATIVRPMVASKVEKGRTPPRLTLCPNGQRCYVKFNNSIRKVSLWFFEFADLK